MDKIFYWLPRILSLLVTGFWIFFVFASHGLSMDTLFESGIWIALLVFTILAWRGQLVGKLGFLVMGILYIIITRGKATYTTVFFIAGPVLLTGILYFFDNKSSQTQKKSPKKIEKTKEENVEDSEVI